MFSHEVETKAAWGHEESRFKCDKYHTTVTLISRPHMFCYITTLLPCMHPAIFSQCYCMDTRCGIFYHMTCTVYSAAGATEG